MHTCAQTQMNVGVCTCTYMFTHTHVHIQALKKTVSPLSMTLFHLAIAMQDFIVCILQSVKLRLKWGIDLPMTIQS